MLAKAVSVALIGTDARVIEIEVDVPGGGLPCFTIVGLPARSVQEAEQRTRSALAASDERWPPGRIVANLAPGALRKDGTHFDLPIALGVLAGQGRLDAHALQGWIFVGELALDGSVRSVPGVLPAAITSRESGRRGIVCPKSNAYEAALVDGIEVVPVDSLKECIDFLRGEWTPPAHMDAVVDVPGDDADDMRDVRGHTAAKRALEVAAAGGHNVLMIGPPGSGKTMLARRLPRILPSMTMEEALEVTRIYSVAGMLTDHPALVRTRPFRTPHHNVSVAGLVGGGAGLARPGEASLAHRGVLFLDELPLYRSDALESLRAPVEEGVVRVARSAGVITFPCRFSLIAAMNPCPCGYSGDARRSCRCTPWRLQTYHNKISGPLLDRIDVQVAVNRLGKKELLDGPRGDSSDMIRSHVDLARDIQRSRYGSPVTTNASASERQFRATLKLRSSAASVLEDAVDGLALTGRGVARVLRLARTVADLAEADEVDESHLGEALGMRVSDAASEVAA